MRGRLRGPPACSTQPTIAPPSRITQARGRALAQRAAGSPRRSPVRRVGVVQHEGHEVAAVLAVLGLVSLEVLADEAAKSSASGLSTRVLNLLCLLRGLFVGRMCSIGSGAPGQPAWSSALAMAYARTDLVRQRRLGSIVPGCSRSLRGPCLRAPAARGPRASGRGAVAAGRITDADVRYASMPVQPRRDRRPRDRTVAAHAVPSATPPAPPGDRTR